MPTPRYSALRALDDPADLRRYLDLKERVRSLTAEMKALEPTIYDALENEDDGRAEAHGFSLEAAISRSYTYPSATQEAERALRERKARDRQTGAATIKAATGFVRVTRQRPDPVALEAAAASALEHAAKLAA